jgi:hypothetical protein
VADSAESVHGVFNGMRVILSESVPTAQGAGSNQDVVYLFRGADLMVSESPVKAYRFDQIGSGALTARLVVTGYSMSWFSRLPSAICKVTGTGLVAPAGY